MSDLKLVAPDQPTALERLLMGAVANEAPSAEQRMRVRQALGLPSVVVAPAPMAHVGRAATLGKAAIGGMLMASAVIALFVSGVGHRLDAPAEHRLSPAPMHANIVPLQAELPPTTAPVEAPLPPAETASRVPAQALVTRSRKLTKGVVSVKSSALGGSALDSSEQMRLIEAARAAVANGNASAALGAISSFNAKFPHGSFGQEAAVLRIEALGLEGNQQKAAALARSFLAQHPNSPHVNVVQGIADHSP
jgi:hypothetical protein